MITTVFNKTYPVISASERIEAEDFNFTYGIKSETCSEGGENIGYVEDGDYIAFYNVDFGKLKNKILARVSSGTNGGTLSIHLDQLNSPAVAEHNIENTGGWQQWVTVEDETESISGAHDVYFKFSGGSGYLFNVNWFEFDTVPNNTIPVESFIYPNQNKGLQFDIYPNPSKKGLVTVSVPLEAINNVLLVYNSEGKLIHERSISNSMQMLELDKGIYFISIQGQKGIITRKLVCS